MAQVRKFSGGGRAKFFYNNEEFIPDDNFIRQYNNAFANDEEMLALVGNNNATIDISYDPFTKEVIARIPKSSEKTRAKRNKQDSFRKDTLAKLMYNRPGKIVEGIDYLSPGERLEIYFDENGNMKADARFDSRMNALFNADTYQNMEGVKDFATLKTIKGAKDLYLSENAKKAWEEFKSNRTKSNFDKFKSYFNEANVYYAEEPKTEAQLAAEAKAEAEADKQAAKSALISKGWDGNIYGDRFAVNENGDIVLIDTDLSTALSNVTGDLWLNNDFKKMYSKAGYDSSWIPEDTGLFRINGKWFLGSGNGFTGNELVKFTNWVNSNRTTPGGNNNLFTQYWSSSNPYERDLADDNMYSYVINPGDYYIDRSGEYVRSEGTPLIYDVLRKNKMNGDIYDRFGHIKRDALERIYIDPYTKRQIVGYNPENLTLESNMNAVSDYYGEGNQNRNTAFVDYIYGNDGAVKLRRVGDFSNDNTGYGIFLDPIKNYYYWHNQNFMGDNRPLNSRFKEMYNSAVIIDPRLAEWIIANAKAIQSNPKLAYAIDEIVRNPWLANGNWRDEYNLGEDIYDKYPTLRELVKQLEITPYKMGEAEFDFNHNAKSSMLNEKALANNWFITFDEKKNGGILKHQFGGVAWNPNTVATKEKAQQIKSPARGAGQAKVIGEGTNLNATDWIEIGALITDAASLGLSFVPGANIAAAGVGAGASVADFVANVKKDGLDISDVGRLVLNLGLDAGTLLPGVGGVSKAAKVAKALTSSKAVAKAIKIASITGTVAGVGNIALSWDRLTDGKWTIEDLRTVLNGLRGVTNLHKMKGSPTKSGKQSETVTLKADGKDPITITKSQYDKIKDLPNNQQKIKMAEIVKSQMPKEAVDSVETKVLTENEKGASDEINLKEAEEILSKYKISFKSSKPKFSWKQPSSWVFWRTGKIGSLDFPDGDRNYYDPTTLPWYHWNRRAAIRDARVNRDNPYFNKMAISDGRIMRSKIGDIPITSYIRGKNTPVINANLMPIFFEEDPKPQSNAFLYKKGGVIKAQNGWLSKLGDKINSGEQSSKPLIDAGRRLNNLVTTEQVYDLRDSMARELGNMRREATILRTDSVGTYLAPTKQHLNAVEKTYSDLKSSIPQTSDAVKNFAMLNNVAGQELTAKTRANAMMSQGISQYNAAATDTYNRQSAINAEKATQESADRVKSNVALLESKAARRGTIGDIYDKVATQASIDNAAYDARRLESMRASKLAGLQALANVEMNKIMEQAKEDYNTYVKNEKAAGRVESSWEDWYKTQGSYQTKIAEINARFASAVGQYQTMMRNPNTGGLFYGFYNDPQWVKYNTYEQDKTHVAGAKKGGKLTAQERRDIDNNKSTNSIQKEKIKSALKTIEQSNKRIYDILNKLL